MNMDWFFPCLSEKKNILRSLESWQKTASMQRPCNLIDVSFIIE